MLDRAAVACLATAVFVALAFGWRSWIQWRRTGSTGFRGIHGRPLSPEWLGGALFATRLMSAVLVGIQPRDPLTLIWACAVFLLVAVAACLAPAGRALRVSPLTALRDG